jgi:RpiR family carbohydrate utilization transcriptional regulator
MTAPDSPTLRIRSLLDRLDGAFRTIASWCLAHDPRELPAAKLTTGEISRRLGVSRVTVVRFCRRLGYSGFPEFKAAWIHEMLSRANADTAQKPQLPATARRIAKLSAESIQATLDSLDPASFAQAVDALCRASIVIWFGVPGDSAFLAMSGEHKLTRAARHTRAATAVEQLRALAQTVGQDGVLIVISQSGRWEFVLPTLELFRQRGCCIVTVTSHAESALAAAADIILLTASREVTLGHEPLAIRAAQLMLIDMLVLETTARLKTVPLRLVEPEIAQLGEADH